MAPWAPLVVAQALLVVAASGNFTFPSNNDLSRFRHDSSLFSTEWWDFTAGRWDFTLLMDGRLARPGAALDATVCSMDDRTWVDFLYTSSAERGYLGNAQPAVARRWWWASYVAASAYLLGLWAGTASMKDRKAYDLRTSLALWNLFLAVFSFIGAARTVPHLLLRMRNFGFEYTICRNAGCSYGSGPSGVWAMFFIYSKYFELMDTVFLVLRKRKVSFLHWYHHCSVLLYCWHAFMWEMPTGIYFVSMNYSVHAIMYFYYFLAATCSRPPSWGLIVTILQLLQMAVGIAITFSHLHFLVNGTVPHCDGHIPNLAAALGMYASYFILFAQFFCNRHSGKRGGGDTKRAGKALLAGKLD